MSNGYRSLSITRKKQYETIVDFMEKNGDLSKPPEGLEARLKHITMWHQLATLLNSDDSGNPKSLNKWPQVWSDLKSQVKKKKNRINQTAKQDGYTSVTKYSLSDLDRRVLAILGEPEHGPSEADLSKTQSRKLGIRNEVPTVWMLEVENEDDEHAASEPSPSTVSPPNSPILQSRSPSPQLLQPRLQVNGINNNGIVEALLELNRLTRENDRNRDRMMYKLEKERLRQRDVELKLQAQWLNFMNGALDAFQTFMQTQNK